METLGFVDSVKATLQKYAVFDGRARRREYWFFWLFCLLAVIVLSILDGMIIGYPVLSGLFNLAVIIPSIAVGIRRLHDIGKSGWWLLIGLVPFIGIIILFVFFLMDSQPGPNQYGANPKGM